MNTWPGGTRRAMSQAEHEAWNSNNYPGTLQLCGVCLEPTGRCEEDEIVIHDVTMCETCSTEWTEENAKQTRDI